MHTQQNSCLHFLQVMWLWPREHVSKPQRRGKGKHVLASPVLLDRALALTALLRIALDPIGGLAVVATFLQPHLRDTAYHGPVVSVDRTPKAELVRRRGTATDGGDDAGEGGLGCRSGAGDGVGARGVGAVLEVWVGGDEVADDELVEAGPGECICGADDGEDEGIRGDEGAALGHAPDEDLLVVCYLTDGICGPARGAERVLAGEGEGGGLGVVETDGADEGFGWVGGGTGDEWRFSTSGFGGLRGGFCGGAAGGAAHGGREGGAGGGWIECGGGVGTAGSGRLGLGGGDAC